MNLPTDIKRGEVWQVNLDPTLGDEIRKTRPCVIMTADGLGRLRLKTVAPITDPARTQALWHVSLSPNPSNGLTKPSMVDAFQVRTLSIDRFIKRLGVLTAPEMDDIAAAISIVLELR